MIRRTLIVRSDQQIDIYPKAYDMLNYLITNFGYRRNGNWITELVLDDRVHSAWGYFKKALQKLKIHTSILPDMFEDLENNKTFLDWYMIQIKDESGRIDYNSLEDPDYTDEDNKRVNGYESYMPDIEYAKRQLFLKTLELVEEHYDYFLETYKGTWFKEYTPEHLDEDVSRETIKKSE